MDRAKGIEWSTWPEKIELFQITRMPPEAPDEGMKENLSNLLGANFLMKGVSKFVLLVF